MRLLIHFARYGPYHHARLRSAAESLAPLGWEVIGLETAGNDSTYAWDATSGGEFSPRVITAFPGRVHEEISAAEYRRGLIPLLDAIAPDGMAIAGWGSADAQLCLSWCRKNDRRRIVMSETREADGKRVWWKERIKRYLISRFDGALVGSKSHRDYLVKLGMPVGRIRFGYNVVDNAYFAEKTQDYKTQDAREEGRSQGAGDRSQETEVRVSEHAPNSLSQLSAFQFSAFTPKYFLASNRFIERKNLSRLIESYSSYIQKSSIQNHQSSIWNLCLLGDGELKADLIAQCHKLGLNVIESAPWEESSSFNIQNPKSKIVYFPGFRQIEELPAFYAHAGCFVHPALEEPWGLVLNEAMACGLPILSGDNVGASEELVDDGVNGWRFDAGKVEEIATSMARITALDGRGLASLGDASRRILEDRCPTAAFGRGLAEILKG